MAKKELLKHAEALGLKVPKRVTVKQLETMITKAEPKAPEQAINLVSCERELRKYVRRDGGFRKGISEADKKRAKEMLKLLGRTKLEWDENIIPIPQRNVVI